MEKKHAISNRARLTIKGIINQPGWAETLAEAYEAGKLAASIPDIPELLPIEGEQVSTFQKRQQTILDRLVDTQISPGQVGCIKKALKVLVAAKRLAPTPDLIEILETLKIKD